MPLASGVMEAICDFKLEGIGGLDEAETGRGCGFFGGATGTEGAASDGLAATTLVVGDTADPAAFETLGCVAV